MTKLPPGTVAAFLTLGGATVAMTRDNDPKNLRFDHRWSCLGCGATGAAPDSAPSARAEANTHASTCRSIPLPDKH